MKCLWVGLAMTAGFAGPLHGQEIRRVPISFLPPPLENATYSLGVYEAKSGKLVRRLQEIAPESAFTVGLNGLITSWDGKDNAGNAVPPGRYTARGYAVGPMKIQGEQTLGNDWATDDQGLRIHDVQAIALVPIDNGLVILAAVNAPNVEQLARYGGSKDELLWQKAASSLEPIESSGKPNCALLTQEGIIFAAAEGQRAAYRLSDGSEISPVPPSPDSGDTATRSAGKDGTVWKVEAGVLNQYSPQGERIRSLIPKAGDPVPTAVAASKTADRLYLLEETESWGIQRVRGLSWKETTQQGDQRVSTWNTFFERDIRHDPPIPGWINNPPSTGIEVTLMDNPLSPLKTPHLTLDAAHDAKGSYLTTSEGLRLRQISQRNVYTARLAKSKTPSSLAFYQSDGAAWDEFSIEGVKNMMEFDAGEFEMTAEGEKVHSEKAAEPPDL